MDRLSIAKLVLQTRSIAKTCINVLKYKWLNKTSLRSAIRVIIVLEQITGI